MVEGLVAISPRDSGTDGAKAAAEWILSQLFASGVKGRIIEFHERSDARGIVPFRNVEGRIPGTTSNIVIIGSHFDTKLGIPGFVGANDSGSSSGLLLELARAIKAQTGKSGSYPEIRFVFFDGEECVQSYGPHDGFHGSVHYASSLVNEGLASNVLAVIVLDMIGDRDLSVTLPMNGTPHLTASVLKAAREENARNRFSLYPGMIGDDHVAFLDRGMPAVDIIDFHFGSAPGKNDYWHTAADTLDKISPESLGLIGRITIRMINDLAERP